MKNINNTKKSVLNTKSKTGKTSLLEIVLIRKELRLDGAVDHLVQVKLSDGNVLYLAVRFIHDQASVCYWQNLNDEDQFLWLHNIAKKRTLKATCKLIFNNHPTAFSTRANAYYELQRDDLKARREILLSKREWRVHEVALFDDGFFVARLSCTRGSKKAPTDNQFIIYPASFQKLDYPKLNTKWKVFTKHGSFNSTLQIDASPLFHALRSEITWPILSDTLKSVEYGYNTQREANAGFEHVVLSQGKTPKKIKYSIPNAIRQQPIDRSITVEVCDQYHNLKETAWLLKAESGYFIARMNAYVTGKIALVQTNISTAFTTIEESAIDLISQQNHSGNKGVSADEIKKQWHLMIDTDLRQRYFIINLHSTWLITDIAMLEGKCVAMKALCLPEVSPVLPVEFQTDTYHILYIDCETSKIINPSPYTRNTNSFHVTKDDFSEELNRLIKKNDDGLSPALKNILNYSRGFTNKNDSDLLWKKLSENWDVEKLTGEACPIPTSLKRKQLEYKLDCQRTYLSTRLARRNEDLSQILEFDKRAKEQSFYPKVLVELAVKYGQCSSDDMLKIKYIENPYRYELTVDVINSFDLNADVRSANHVDIRENIDGHPSITSTVKSNAGRKKLHESSTERKRLWAQKDRISKRQHAIEMGLKPKKTGPEKIYSTPAEKQAAYRFRTKWGKASINTALIYIGSSQTNSQETLAANINKIIPYFSNSKGQQSVIALIPEENGTDINNTNEHITRHVTANNVYIISSHNYYELINDKLKYLSVERVIFCGFSITDICYRLACYLNENGYEILITKNCLHTDDTWELEVGLKLFQKKFGKNSLL
jgi:hypothetical protein